MMKHKMKLHNEPFVGIKNGTKTIEMRLNDKKRQLIKIGDIIEFENRLTFEVIHTQVINIYKFNNFDELYNYFDKVSIGYNEDETANPNDMKKYYSKEEQDCFGVLGIEIKLIV